MQSRNRVETHYTIVYRSFHKTFPNSSSNFRPGGLKHGACGERGHTSMRLSIFRKDNGSPKVCRAKTQSIRLILHVELRTHRRVETLEIFHRTRGQCKSYARLLTFYYRPFLSLSLFFSSFFFPLYHFRDNRNENLHRFSAPLDFIFTMNSSDTCEF